MPYDPKIHHRRSIRLKDYDYSRAGAYFVTICVHKGKCELGDIVDDEVQLSLFGRIAADCWEDLPNHYAHLLLDAFVIMPNHIHGIVVLEVGAGFKPALPDETMGAGFKPALPDETMGADIKPALPDETMRAGHRPAPTKRHPLSEIVRGFKTFSAKHINTEKNVRGVPFWQRNYYEHVIRNERAYHAIREYIFNNAMNWNRDQLHPHAPANQFNRYWR